VTVAPLVTTVVGLSVVVTAAAEVCGVLGGVDLAGSGSSAEVGLLDCVGGTGTPALVVTASLVWVVAVGASAELVGRTLGAGVVVAGSVAGRWVVLGTSVVGDTEAVGVSMRGAGATVALVVGTGGVDAGTVGVGVSTGAGTSVFTGGSSV